MQGGGKTEKCKETLHSLNIGKSECGRRLSIFFTLYRHPNPQYTQYYKLNDSLRHVAWIFLYLVPDKVQSILKTPIIGVKEHEYLKHYLGY